MNPSEMIDRLIAETDDWRGPMLATIRRIMFAADPEVTEDWKWMGTPTWYCDGLIGIANPHAGKVKITFAQGALIEDPDRLFNSGLEGNARRAIDIFEKDRLDEKKLLRLIRSVIELNRSRPTAKAKPKAKPSRPSKAGKRPKAPAKRR